MARDETSLADLTKRLEILEKEIDKITVKQIDNELELERANELEKELQDVQDQIKREEEFKHSSSFIGIVRYSIDFQSMEIEMNGRTYPYCGVPQRVYDAFKADPSPGTFFNRAIKNIYEC